MPLDAVKPGMRVLIVGLTAGESLRGRLAAMGLVPGTPVEVIANSTRGPFIVSVKGSRIVLGHGMAQKIMVV